jgi:hypothetical protein
VSYNVRNFWASTVVFFLGFTLEIK